MEQLGGACWLALHCIRMRALNEGSRGAMTLLPACSLWPAFNTSIDSCHMYCRQVPTWICFSTSPVHRINLCDYDMDRPTNDQQSSNSPAQQPEERFSPSQLHVRHTKAHNATLRSKPTRSWRRRPNAELKAARRNESKDVEGGAGARARSDSASSTSHASGVISTSSSSPSSDETGQARKELESKEGDRSEGRQLNTGPFTRFVKALEERRAGRKGRAGGRKQKQSKESEDREDRDTTSSSSTSSSSSATFSASASDSRPAKRRC
ncbi:hypothetical protein BDY17DRAFT_12272 [Neohortaea acidophila]|uniref:Uncharacterized protein n=1 Tax=Neohortaea acidophila TaxID=245834 RepID=A0A6A6Q4W8_9PEZI|nr:uncharacterized protein BDY17DRAFT_12272 [Neohortaea acidophila]KAF2487488.1 hypothetical protein BDY17DRAFT_12272 [Neohortaea acidophila]